MKMLDTEIQEEIQKCISNPYYFATTYMVVNGKPFTTPLDEDIFNKYFFRKQELDYTKIKSRQK